MASLTQWTWVWENSGSWWWTRRTGVLQSIGSQRVGHNWVTELNWILPCTFSSHSFLFLTESIRFQVMYSVFLSNTSSQILLNSPLKGSILVIFLPFLLLLISPGFCQLISELLPLQNSPSSWSFLSMLETFLDQFS